MSPSEVDRRGTIDRLTLAGILVSTLVFSTVNGAEGSHDAARRRADA